MNVSFNKLYSKKIILKDFLENRLSIESKRRAMNDSHAKRFPRPCGLTIHSAVGCNLNCVYCYVPEIFGINYMVPYGLSGEELILALLSNKYFFPTIYGTYLAFGSITEPFHPIASSKTFEYLYFIDKYLGNPVQFSTKFFLREDQINLFKKYRNISLSPLITLISIKYASILEPNAPKPEKRLELIRSLRKAGFKPFIFYRPLIPYKVFEEAENVLREAKRAGAIGVIIGGFRVTERIVMNLKKIGFTIEANIPKNFKGQYSLHLRKYKDSLIKISREIGLIPFKSACCANTYSILLNKGLRIPCSNLCFQKNFCTNCPVDCKNISVNVEMDDVRSAFKKIMNIEPDSIDIQRNVINISIKKKLSGKRRREIVIIERIFRKKINIIR